MDAVLSGSIDTKVVADLHAGDLGIISEDPVNTILQETNDVRVSNSNNRPNNSNKAPLVKKTARPNKWIRAMPNGCLMHCNEEKRTCSIKYGYDNALPNA